MCTGLKRVLVNPISTSGSLTTDLRYDVGGECRQEGERLVIVAGKVTDRLGATAELCDRDSKCPFAAFSPKGNVLNNIQTGNLIRGVQNKLTKNQITKMQAVDELTFAVQTRNAQTREKFANDDETRKMSSSSLSDLIEVLQIVKAAADDVLGAETRQTPRFQGALILLHAFCWRHIYSQVA